MSHIDPAAVTAPLTYSVEVTLDLGKNTAATSPPTSEPEVAAQPKEIQP